MWVLLGDLMDKRELKKHILFEMLNQYHSIFHQQDDDAKRESAELVMDIPYGKNITDAQYKRYLLVMDQLVDEAEKKLN